MKLTTLSGKPADFSLMITAHELDGSEVKIPLIGIGRTTLDWQPISLARIESDTNTLIEQEEKLEAEKIKAAKEEQACKDAESGKSAKRKRMKMPHAEIAKSTEQGIKSAIAMVREVASGWELDDEFSDENITKLVTRYPGVSFKLWQEYDSRIKGNRLGNSGR